MKFEIKNQHRRCARRHSRVRSEAAGVTMRETLALIATVYVLFLLIYVLPVMAQ